MIVDRINQIAETEGGQYELSLEAFRSTLLTALQANPATPRALHTMEMTLWSQKEAATAGLRDRIAGHLHTIAGAASLAAAQDTGNTAAEIAPSTVLLEHIGNLTDYMLSELDTQTSRDVASVRHQAKEAGLQIQRMASAYSSSIQSAHSRYMNGSRETSRFYFHDRAGRRYPSAQYVRALWRQNLLAVYNETYLHMIAEAGHKRAFISHPDRSSRHYGVEFAIHPGDVLPSYHEIRDTHFHPNSHATVSVALEKQ